MRVPANVELIDPVPYTRMLELLTDADRRAELAARGRERAREFSWRRTAELTLETLELAAGR